MRLQFQKLAAGVVDSAQRRCVGTAFFIAECEDAVTAAHVLEGLSFDHLQLALGRSLTGVLGAATRESGFASLSPLAEVGAHRLRPRRPEPGETVFIVGWPRMDLSDPSLGPRVVRTNIMAVGNDGRVETYGSLPIGFSGAPIVAAQDACVVGMVDGLRLVEEEGPQAFSFVFAEGLLLTDAQPGTIGAWEGDYNPKDVTKER